MPDPVLHVLAGPNGAGKSELYERVIGPVTHLDLVSADLIAAERWPEDPEAHAYEAAESAAALRAELIGQRTSFVAETVFSHESKIELVDAAVAAGYLVTLHVLLVPEGLAIARVANRASLGGYSVPVAKIRSRYRRLWPLVASAIPRVQHTVVYDNCSSTRPFRVVAQFEQGLPLGARTWPRWTPKPLRATNP